MLRSSDLHEPTTIQILLYTGLPGGIQSADSIDCEVASRQSDRVMDARRARIVPRQQSVRTLKMINNLVLHILWQRVNDSISLANCSGLIRAIRSDFARATLPGARANAAHTLTPLPTRGLDTRSEHRINWLLLEEKF